MPYSGPRSPSLPRRKSTTTQPPVFHLHQDDGDSSQEDDHEHKHTVTSSTNQSLSFHDHKAVLTKSNAVARSDAIPFPRSSPQSSSPTGATRPLPTRSSSHSVLLSNGKPLKSSLKSSSSHPEISASPRSMHLRTRSAPSTPGGTPKNVHFAEQDCLATIRVFSRSARPAALLRPIPGDDTETETDTDRPGGTYPFPRISSPSPPSSPLFTPICEIDRVTTGATSPIPRICPSLFANVHVETIDLSYSPASINTKPIPTLSGTILVRNVAFEKQAAIRFTLDEWQTTSEVLAHHVTTLLEVPKAFAPRSPGDAAAVTASGIPRTWDRFAFTIRLEDYASKLHQRVMWFVARFNAPGGEWWDNNSGHNYRVAFRHTSNWHRPQAVSAPVLSFTSRNEPQQHATHVTRHIPHLTAPPIGPRLGALPQRLSKLHLLNYAAPVPRTTPPASPDIHRPSLSELSDLLSPTRRDVSPDRPNVPVKPPTIIGGQPVSWASDPDSPTPANDSVNGIGNGVLSHIVHTPRSFGSFGGFSTIALRWPWGSMGVGGAGVGVERGPDESEVLADFRPAEDEDRTGLGSRVLDSPLPYGSRSSRSPSPDLDRLPSSRGGDDGAFDHDPVYKAFVRKWCFAEGPLHPPMGNGGLVVG